MENPVQLVKNEDFFVGNLLYDTQLIAAIMQRVRGGSSYSWFTNES